MASSSSQDEEVQSTNDDAASSKRLAVQLGYWKDPYIQYFAKSCHKKPPELNRGYYARVKGIESLVKQFLELTDHKCQVVNLGAGSDTLFWNLCDQGQIPVKWIELDFESVVIRKIRAIRSYKPLLDKLKMGVGDSYLYDSSLSVKPAEVHTSIYHLLPCDLRNLNKVEDALNKCNTSFSTPTLFICECVLIYIDATSSSSLIKWIADNFLQAFFINYEQVNMEDRFGEVMIENLMARGCSLVGVKHCRDFQTHFERFNANGWDGADGGNVLQIYKSLPQDEIKRIEKLEFLDDQEMLIQLFSHYCITWAYKNAKQSPENIVDFSKISLLHRK